MALYYVSLGVELEGTLGIETKYFSVLLNDPFMVMMAPAVSSTEKKYVEWKNKNKDKIKKLLEECLPVGVRINKMEWYQEIRQPEILLGDKDLGWLSIRGTSSVSFALSPYLG